MTLTIRGKVPGEPSRRSVPPVSAWMPAGWPGLRFYSGTLPHLELVQALEVSMRIKLGRVMKRIVGMF